MAILSEDELREALAGRREWRRSGDALVRERAVRDFAEALAFVERIGNAVEDYGRHPDISITGGNRVRVVVTNTHGAGFTDAEVRLVEKVDEVADAPIPAPRPPVAAAVAPEAPAAEPAAAAAEEPAPAEAPQEGRRGRRTVFAAAAGAAALGVASVLVARRR